MDNVGPSPHSTTPSFQTFPGHRLQSFFGPSSPNLLQGSPSPSSPLPFPLAHSIPTSSTLLRGHECAPAPRPLHWLHPLPKMLFFQVSTESATSQMSSPSFLTPLPPSHLLSITSFYFVFPIIFVSKQPYSLAYLVNVCFPH